MIDMSPAPGYHVMVWITRITLMITGIAAIADLITGDLTNISSMSTDERRAAWGYAGLAGMSGSVARGVTFVETANVKRLPVDYELVMLVLTFAFVYTLSHTIRDNTVAVSATALGMSILVLIVAAMVQHVGAVKKRPRIARR